MKYIINNNLIKIMKKIIKFKKKICFMKIYQKNLINNLNIKWSNKKNNPKKINYYKTLRNKIY